MNNLKEQLLDIMIDKNASDMYITVGAFPTMKIKGKLVDIKYNNEEKLNNEITSQFASTIMSEEQRETFARDKEIDFAFSYLDARFRVNIFLQQGYTSVALRFLPGEIPSFDDLGLPDIFRKIMDRESGIILVAGPTGHGKTSTLTAMLDHINTNSRKHIITIEDPIEYIHPHKLSVIEQREVGTDTHSFARALKSALRQNPHVVMLGEMRDLESISNAITIAETGHLVLATIHANSSAQCISKIIDSFPSEQQNQIRQQLSGSIAAIFSQRLLPKKDGSGLVLATEAMIRTSGIASQIRENQIQQIPSQIQMGKSDGMHMLEDSLIDLVETDQIDLDEALRWANNPNIVKEKFQR